MAKGRLYFKVEIEWAQEDYGKAFHYSCYSRPELHEFINEQTEILAFEWAKSHFWGYADQFVDEFALFEAVLPKFVSHIYEVPSQEFYGVDYATMRV